jgi:ammonia channel protein AmtB
LLGILFLGPRIGKYGKDGSINAIPGHSMALATLGGLILWLGWFGFNPGSTMAANTDIARIAVTTAMAAAAGVAAATAYAWLRLGTPDLSMIVNGSLAGLVAITASCAVVSITDSVFIGLIAGALVVEAVITFDKLHIDDPVGATSVHLVNGIWGTLAVGLFANPAVQDGVTGLFHGGGFRQLGVQVLGVAVVGAFTVALSAALWFVTACASPPTKNTWDSTRAKWGSRPIHPTSPPANTPAHARRKARRLLARARRRFLPLRPAGADSVDTADGGDAKAEQTCCGTAFLASVKRVPSVSRTVLHAPGS